MLRLAVLSLALGLATCSIDEITLHWEGLGRRAAPRLLAANESGPAVPVSAYAPSGVVSDGQDRVANTLTSPFYAIGMLRTFDAGGGEGICTASLISMDPLVAVTAGHCWVDINTRQPSLSAYWVPAFTQPTANPAPYGIYSATAVKVGTPFVDCPTSDPASYNDCQAPYDFSIFFLTPVEPSTTTTYPPLPEVLPYGFNDSLLGTFDTLSTAGYPGDKCYNSTAVFPSGDFFDCAMWHTSCPNSAYVDNNGTSFDSCLSGEGQSGSVMWIEPTPGQLLVVGILTAAPTTGPLAAVKAPDGETPTLYVPVTEAWFNNVTTWIADGPTSNSTGAYLYQAQPVSATNPSLLDLTLQAAAAEAPASNGPVVGPPVSAAGE